MTKMVVETHKNIYVQTFALFAQLAGTTIKYMDNRFFRDYDLSFVKYSVLRALVRNGGILKHTQLAGWTNTKKHNITALVDRMKEDQLVSTEWSQVDRRVNNVVITEKGQKLYEQANSLAREMVEQMMNGMKEIDVEEFERLLNIIKANIERN
jgi:DNA-binding MarR family transcriptional regulator